MSLFMSALSCGVPWNAAIAMPLSSMRMLVDARNDMYGSRDEGTPGVRDATQGDIRRLFAG